MWSVATELDGTILTSRAGSPASRTWTSTSCQINGSIRLEIKSAINVMGMNYPETIPPPPGLWKNCLLRNWSLAPKRLGAATLGDKNRAE